MSGRRDRKIQCPCQSCESMGGKSVKMSTATEHLKMQNAVERVLRQFDGRQMDENEAQDDLTEPNLVVDEDNELDDQTEEDLKQYDWEAQDFELEYGREIHGDRKSNTLEEAILNQIIYVQSICDKHGASIGLQDFLMHQFGGGFNSQRSSRRELDFNQQPGPWITIVSITSWMGWNPRWL